MATLQGGPTSLRSQPDSSPESTYPASAGAGAFQQTCASQDVMKAACEGGGGGGSLRGGRGIVSAAGGLCGTGPGSYGAPQAPASNAAAAPTGVRKPGIFMRGPCAAKKRRAGP
ncbi:MAG TPA: hypothetical protein VGR32_03375 [Brevundimonas sp.]|uniref:hypothetical protein n=1 Tax=Brevundimonas sp. TaxID=1871086 RepID=UPI002DF6223B|nr:hypothetical protein [Brevundimonas sp.]